MESTTQASEDLFHLFADLSNVKSRDLLITVFINKMGEIFHPAVFSYNRKLLTKEKVFELKGDIHHWGCIEIINGYEPSDVASGYIIKAARLFTFLLDNVSLNSDCISSPSLNSSQAANDGVKFLAKEDNHLGISLNNQSKSYFEVKKTTEKEELESYRHLFDSMSQGVIIQNNEGVITSINPSAKKILGIESKEVIGSRPLEDGWNVKDRQLNDVSWDGLPPVVALRERRAVRKEVIGVLNPSNEDFRWLLLDSIPLFDKRRNTPSQVYTCFSDYTKQKKTEDQLLLLSHSVEQSPVSVIITNAAGKIEYINPTFSEVTGYTFEEIKGKDPGAIKSGENPQSLYENLWNTILRGEKWTGELINRKKDGSLYWEQLIVSPIVENNGKISHFIAIREDISEKKGMIDNLVKEKERAEESDRLKTAFLANISHEIRTPMNGILGFLELLRNPELNDDEKDQYIDIVNRSGDRLLSTINDLVEISKIESGQVGTDISPVYVPEVMEYYLQFFLPDAQKKHLGLEIACQIEDSDALIQTDRSKIEVTLSNLLTNSIKFTEVGEIEFGNYIKGDTLVFFVKDTGVGISPDHMDIVFERFGQADLNMTRPYQGTGLGLSIVKGYIEILKGKIWVESQLDVGSTFYFTIPYNPVKP